jgi:hypothetical protein
MANSTIKTAFYPTILSTLPWQPEHRYYFKPVNFSKRKAPNIPAGNDRITDKAE